MLASLLALALTAAGAVTLLTTPAAEADDGDGRGIAPVSEGADPASYHEIPGWEDGDTYYLQSSAPGRVWTDKSVFVYDTVPLTDNEGDDLPVMEIGVNEIAVALSALTSTRHVDSVVQVPIDVVMILDISTSMSQCVGSDGYCNTPATVANSRAYALAEGVNAALRIIHEDNPDNRVGIVTFGNDASTMMSLTVPQPITGDTYAQLTMTGTGGSSVMTLRVGTATVQIGNSSGNVQSTNTHRGVAQGMALLTAQTAAVRQNAPGGALRLPNVILFSDGEPTYSSTSTTWWAPPTCTTASCRQGPSMPGANQYYGNGFLAALAAAHLKNQVADVYRSTATDLSVAPKVYSVGLGIDGMDTTITGSSPPATNGDLARITLDPRTYLGDTSNAMAAGFTAAFATYRTAASVQVPVNGTGGNPSTYYTVTHPTGAAAAFDPAGERGIVYNDAAYWPANEQDMIAIFTQIAQEMIAAAPNYPIQRESAGATGEGYVTFVDELGPFMEVSDINRLMFCILDDGDPDPQSEHCDRSTFTDPVRTTVGATDTYTFSGQVAINSLAGPRDVAGIEITVDRRASLAQGDLVTVRIPVDLLPIRNTTVVEDEDGNPIEIHITAAHPVHLYYKVTPKAGVLENLSTPHALNTATSNDGDLLASYIATHRDPAGRIRFYSNDFAGSDGTGFTGGRPAAARPGAALTSASFVPAVENRFYNFGEDEALFLDAARTQPLAFASFQALAATPDLPIWYEEESYTITLDPVTQEPVYAKQAVARSTSYANLVLAESAHPERGGVFAGPGGQAFAPIGMGDFNADLYTNLDHVKCHGNAPQEQNPVQFADQLDSTASPPVCADPAGHNVSLTDPMARRTTRDAHVVTQHLGAVGFLDYLAPGALRLEKQVEVAPGLSPDPATGFAVDLDLVLDLPDGALPPAEGFPYSIYTTTTAVPIACDAGGATTCYLPAGGGPITLRAGQYAVVGGLPEGTTWSAAETAMPPGWRAVGADEPVTGEIALPQPQVPRAVFVNAYEPSPASATVAVSKELTGRAWTASDTFDLVLADDAGAPVDVVTITSETPSYTATFAPQVFDAPGTYTYVISEARPAAGALPGVTYSAAEYLWTLVVADDGAGALFVASESLVRTRDTAGEPVAEAVTGTPSFTNAYDPGELGLNLDATKAVQDSSLGGALRAPTWPYAFTFAAEGDGPLFRTAAGELASAVVVTTDPFSAIVRSPELVITTAHAGGSFTYTVTEEPVDYHGVTIDPRVFRYTVEVGRDVAGDGALSADVTVCVVTDAGCEAADAVAFVNAYQPTDGQAVLGGAKVLTGRPWYAGEEFAFALAPHDAGTAAAGAAGAFALPDPPVATATAGDPGFVFGPITFHHQGTYRFEVVEVIPAPVEDRMAYDGHALVYEVVVTDAIPVGTLDVAVAVVDLVTGDPEDTDYRVFTNRYAPEPLHLHAALDGTYPVDWAWSLQKTADPARQGVRPGTDAVFDYRIVVGAAESVGQASAVGAVEVTNPNPFPVAAPDVAATVSDGEVTVGAPQGLVDGQVPALGSASWPLTWTGADGVVPGDVTVTPVADGEAWPAAHATFSRAESGYLRLLSDTFPELTDAYPADDLTLDARELPDGGWEFTYTAARGAELGDADAGEYPNTAWLAEEPGPAPDCGPDDPECDTATVSVHTGADLAVVTTTLASLRRVYDWSLVKTLAPGEVALKAADAAGTATFDYEVTVTPGGFADADWQLTGTATVTNPNPWPVTLTSVTDDLALGEGASCAFTPADEDVPARVPAATEDGPGVLDAGYSCTFAGEPSPDGSNTVTVTWDPGEALSAGSAATATTEIGEDTWERTFGNAVVEVWDDRTDPAAPVLLGTVAWNPFGIAETFPYALTLAGPPGGHFSVDHTNWAWLVPADDEPGDDEPGDGDPPGVPPVDCGWRGWCDDETAAVYQEPVHDLALRAWVSHVYRDLDAVADGDPVVDRSAITDIRNRPGPVYTVPHATFDQEGDVQPGDYVVATIAIVNQSTVPARVTELRYTLAPGMTLAADVVQDEPWQPVAGGDLAVLALTGADGFELDPGENATTTIWLRLEPQEWFDALPASAWEENTELAVTGGPENNLRGTALEGNALLAEVRELESKLGQRYVSLDGYAEIGAFEGWVPELPEPVEPAAPVEPEPIQPMLLFAAVAPLPLLTTGPADAASFQGVAGYWDAAVDVDSVPASDDHLTGKVNDNSLDTTYAGGQCTHKCAYDLRGIDEDDHDGETLRVIRVVAEPDPTPTPDPTADPTASPAPSAGLTPPTATFVPLPRTIGQAPGTDPGTARYAGTSAPLARTGAAVAMLALGAAIFVTVGLGMRQGAKRR